MSEEIEIQNFIDPEQVKRDMMFDITDVNTALQTHASLYVHYAGIAVRCRGQMDRMKQQLELVENILDTEHRTRLKAENPKVTEPQIRSAVVTDRRWRAASQRLIEASSQYRTAETVERGFEHRKDMLLMVSRNLLRESEGALRVVANQDARERVLAAMKRNSERADA